MIGSFTMIGKGRAGAAAALSVALIAGLLALAPAALAQEAVADDTQTRGAVTNLPLPRYVSLKGNEGNARRGPSLTHRIDWVFTRAGMPLKVTAEYENWRRVEDAEGFGGWVHYSLLSGVRSALVTGDRVAFYNRPRADADVVFEAEAGVIGELLECDGQWCRLEIAGERGWAPIPMLWGADAGEVFE